MNKINRKHMKLIWCLVMTAALLLTAGCGGVSGGEETTAGTKPQETTLPAMTEPETTVPVVEGSPMDMAGTWERAYTEVEGDRVETAPGTCIIVIAGESEDQLSISYTDREFPEQSYADKALHIVPDPEYTIFEQAVWVMEVEHTGPFGTSFLIALLEDGTLLVQNYWEMDGMPMVSHEWFRRVE